MSSRIIVGPINDATEYVQILNELLPSDAIKLFFFKSRTIETPEKNELLSYHIENDVIQSVKCNIMRN
jgi:hypothetical protein